MPGEKFYKLDTISILPQYVTMTNKALIHNNQHSQFRLQLWLDGVLLDQKYGLKRQDDNQNQSVLNIENTTFRYFASNVFTKASTAKFKLKLYKSETNLQNILEIQQFNIVLSKFSYNYCKQSLKSSKEHSVGTKNCSILYYRIVSEYTTSQVEDSFKSLQEAQKEAERQERQFARIKLSEMIESDKQKKSSLLQKNKAPNAWLGKNSLNVLPLNSLSGASLISISQEPVHSQLNSRGYGQVFIETDQLRPIYNTQKSQIQNVQFKIQKSYIDIDKKNLYIEQESILKNRKQFEQKSDKFLNVVYYIYLMLGLFLIYLSLHPNRRL